jgi:hypothetical protein
MRGRLRRGLAEATGRVPRAPAYALRLHSTCPRPLPRVPPPPPASNTGRRPSRAHLSSVQLMATTPGRMKQAMLSTWPFTTSVSPAMPIHSQITFGLAGGDR